MEDYLIVVLTFMIGIFSLVGVKMFKPNQSKNKQKTRKDAANETLDKINEETIERLADQLKKEAGRANRLQALKDKLEDNEEELEENGQKQVTFEEIQTLVKTKYPKQAILLPLIKTQIMDATKGMTMEEILGYVKQFTGNQQSEANPIAPDAAGNTWRPDYA